MPRTTRLVACLSFERRKIDVNISKDWKLFRFILKMIKKLYIAFLFDWSKIL